MPDGDSKLAVLFLSKLAVLFLFTDVQLDNEDRTKLPTNSIIREETRADRDQSPAKRQRIEFETNLEEDRDGEPLDIEGDWEDDHGSVLVGQSRLFLGDTGWL